MTARGIRFEPVFTEMPEAPARAGDDDGGPPMLSRFLRAVVDANSAAAVAEELSARPDVAAAYVKPPVEPPLYRMPDGVAAPDAGAEVLAAAPDYSGRQGYLEAAPVGVDARAAWTEAGGRAKAFRSSTSRVAGASSTATSAATRACGAAHRCLARDGAITAPRCSA